MFLSYLRITIETKISTEITRSLNARPTVFSPRIGRTVHAGWRIRTRRLKFGTRRRAAK